MKKCLLLNFAMGMTGIILAQSNVPHSVTPQKISAQVINKKESYNKKQLPGAEATPSFSAMAATSKLIPKNPALKAYTTATIGNTGYQLQTNAALCNRVVLNSDGTIGATWTMSQLLDGAWSDRGTGYNYFNGTSWGATPSVRIENVRTGFTNLGVTGSNAEFVVSHEASDIHVASRPTKGTGTWTNTALGFPDVWSRMSVGGTAANSIHIISQTTGIGNPPYMGQDGAIAYTRSQDGGATWDKIRTVIPQIDSASYLGFGGDSYAIDARGNTIAIVAGGFEVDVVMIKSTDNGDTWTKTIVHPFAIPLFDEATMTTDIDGDGTADILETNDASVAVLIDNNDKVHVWYGNMNMMNDAIGDGSISYYPFTDGLMYWNENMGAAAPVMIAAAEDLNGDDSLNVAAIGTYQVSLSSHPSAGIDASGKLFVAYSSIFEGDPDGNGKHYRHTYVMRSDDGGVTWCEPHDVTDPGGIVGFTEGVYGAMARDVDTHVHLVVQQDAEVGHGVSTTTPADPNSGAADIVYVKIPVADLACGVGIDEMDAAQLSTALFPNPASATATLTIASASGDQATVKIYNALGELVKQFSNEVAAGTHRIELNLASFNRGIYFVNVTMAGKTATEKLIIE